MPTTHPQRLVSQIEQNGCLNIMHEPEVMINEELHAPESCVKSK
jgi:hypothetical protein